MRLYLLNNPFKRGWAAAIVGAESEAHARTFHPDSENDVLPDRHPDKIFWDAALGSWQQRGVGPVGNWPRPDELIVTDLGEMDPHLAAGIYLADIFPYYPESGDSPEAVWRGSRTPDPQEEAERRAEITEFLARFGLRRST